MESKSQEVSTSQAMPAKNTLIKGISPELLSQFPKGNHVNSLEMVSDMTPIAPMALPLQSLATPLMLIINATKKEKKLKKRRSNCSG